MKTKSKPGECAPVQQDTFKNRSAQFGATLAEVMVAVAVLSLVSVSAVSGFVFLQKSSMYNAYYAGGQRVLQSHVERLMSVPLEELTNQTVINYNYSGLKVTSVGTLAGQTNLDTKVKAGFTAFTNSPLAGSSIIPVSFTTNTVEDAVLAYSTIVVVRTNVSLPASNLFGPGSATLRAYQYNGNSVQKRFRVALVRTMWQNFRGKVVSHEAVVVRSEN